MKRIHRLEAVTVCVGMDDFLFETAKYNYQHFDEWIIITSPQDHKTRELCRKFNLRVLLTDDHERHGTPFNKGRALERALCLTTAGSWRVHLDADIALPNGFRHLIETAELHEDSIYGADRIDIHSYQDWKKFEATGFMHHSLRYHCNISVPSGYSIGARWSHPRFGYVPIGFFQLWHSSQDEWRGIRVKTYPQSHGSACRSDVQFALQWDRYKRGVVPELLVAHLMSEKSPNGVNWNGRKTKPFGPDWLESVPKNIGS